MQVVAPKIGLEPLLRAFCKTGQPSKKAHRRRVQVRSFAPLLREDRLVAVLAWLWLVQKPSVVTIFAGVAGVGFLVLGPHAAPELLGVMAAFGGALSFAVGVVLTRRWAQPDVPVLLFTAWQLTAGGLFSGLLSLVLEGLPPRLTPAHLLGFLYLGIVGTGLAYALWFRGIEKLGVSVIFLSLLSPVVAALLGYVVLGQSFSLGQSVGVLLILSSVIAGQLGTLARSSTPLADAPTASP